MATHQHQPDPAAQEIATGTTFVHRLCAGEHEAHNWYETLVRCITGGQWARWPTDRTDGPISRTAPYRPAASDPYGQRVKGASALSIIRRVHQSSSVFAGRLPAGQPHAGPPPLCDSVFSSCAAIATQPIQPIQPVCANSAGAAYQPITRQWWHLPQGPNSNRYVAVPVLAGPRTEIGGNDALSHVGFSTNFFFL